MFHACGPELSLKPKYTCARHTKAGRVKAKIQEAGAGAESEEGKDG